MTGEQVRAARLEAAAGWYAELQDDDLAPDVWERFRLWESDPENAAAFREIEATLAVLDRSKLARRPGRAKPSKVWAWTGAMAAAAALVAAVVVWTQSDIGPAAAPEAEPVTYMTGIGERREIILADGSAVTLNTATRLEVAFSPDERLIRLESGQALFDVVADEVPFTVETAGRRTTALGTRFDVHLMPDGLAVTLVEGVVRVAGKGGDTGSILAPGEQLRVERGKVSILPVDTAAVTGWQTGMVQFRDATLAEAVAELNRYSEVKLRVDDPDLAAERLSGVFTTGDQDLFLESLSLYLPVVTEQSGDDILIRRRPE